MTQVKQNRGGAPVGFLAELDSVEAGAVIYLRLWSEGPSAQKQIEQDFQTALGVQQGTDAATCFSDLCHLCATRAASFDAAWLGVQMPWGR